MKKTVLATLILLSPAFASAATFTTYTDKAAFTAASGMLSDGYDFNSEVDEVFTTKDFGDFSATLNNGVAGFDPITYKDKLYLQVRDPNSELAIDFDYGIKSFGFDWTNTDPTGDQIEVSILGQNFVFGSALSSGFFGVIADTKFMNATFSGNDTNGFGDLTFGSLDNFEYSAVPVPAAAFLLAPALLGFMGLRRKARKSV